MKSFALATHRFVVLLLAVGLINLTGCGAKGNGVVQTPPPPTPTITSVSVSCVPGTVRTGQMSQCSAVVQGTGSFSNLVTWSVDQGTIDTTGKYTAPGTATTATVKAVSMQDKATSGTASIAVTTPPPPPTPVVTAITPAFLWADGPGPILCVTLNGSEFDPSDMFSITPQITLLPPPSLLSSTQASFCPGFDTPDFVVSWHTIQLCSTPMTCSAPASFGFLGDGQNTLVGTPDGGFLNLDQGQGIATNGRAFIRAYDANGKLLQSINVTAGSAIAYDESSQAILVSAAGAGPVSFYWLNSTPSFWGANVSGSSKGIAADGKSNGCVAQPNEGLVTGFLINNISFPPVTPVPAGTQPWAVAAVTLASGTGCVSYARGNNEVDLFSFPGMTAQGSSLKLTNLATGGEPNIVAFNSGTAAGTAAVFNQADNQLVFVSLSTMTEIRRVQLTSTLTSAPIQIFPDPGGAAVIVAYGDVSDNGKISRFATVSVASGGEVPLTATSTMPNLAGGLALSLDHTQVWGAMGMGALPTKTPYVY